MIYWVVLALSSAGVIIWQATDIAAVDRPIVDQVPTLIFQDNDDRLVGFPEDLEQQTVVVFWRVGSRFCQDLIADVREYQQQLTDQFEVDIYLVNLGNDLTEIRKAVDYDNLDLRFGHSPSGTLLERIDANTLPITVYLSAGGRVLYEETGYRPNQIWETLKKIEMSNKFRTMGSGF